jgi:methionine-gamma-lyase
MNDPKQLGFSTRAIHVEAQTPSIASRTIVTPIYQTASFAFDRMEEIPAAIHDPEHAYVYSRLSNPTADIVERTIAELEGGAAGLTFASGMAAIHGVFATLCKAGDHIVAPVSMYGGSFSLLRQILPRFGVETTFVKNGDHDAVREAMRPNTKVVYSETIGNPALFVSNIPLLAEIAHGRGAKLVIDSTFASPYLCRPLEHGADVVVHSASKYLGGHGDLIAGLAVSTAETMKEIRHTSIDVGGAIAPFVAWLLLRGLKTLAVRMDRHCGSARQVADFLARHPKVERVVYPGLASHPDHAVAAKLLSRGFGGMVAFDVRGDRAVAARAMDRLKIIKRAGSLGDVHSLALQPAATSHRQLSPEELVKAGISEGFVRLSVGLEDPGDLCADLDQALGA